MLILDLTISGFRSFTAEQTLAFAGQPGLYQLFGHNEVAPELGANGTGKSSTWDALTWILYGWTTRGLRASDIANWDFDHVTTGSVTICLDESDPGNPDVWVKITRTWKPNSLTITNTTTGEARTATQGDIDALVGLSYEQWLFTVVIGQFGSTFFDLTAADKLRVFSEVLGLEVWMKASEATKAELKACEKERNALQVEMSRCEGQIQTIEQTISELQREADRFVAERDVSLKKIENQIRTLTAQLAEDEGRVAQLELELDDDEGTSEDAEASLAQWRDYREQVQRALGDVRAKIAAANVRARNCEDQVNRIRKYGPTCTTCEQAISPEFKRAALQVTEEALGRAVEEIRLLIVNETTLTKDYQHAGEVIDSAVQDIAVDRAQAVAKQRALASATLEANDTRRDLTNARAAFQDLQGAVNPYLGQIATHAKYLDEARNLWDVLHQDHNYYKGRADHLSYWIKGFRDLRLWLVQSALDQLAVETNNCLMQLGLHGWSVTFDIERETASGTISRGFTVLIQPPGHDEPVCWESWSGGETQRLRIAGAMGLASLIRQRTGFRCNLEVWDEPTAHLSEQGVTDLLRCLEERAVAEQREVWIVDHRSTNHPFAGSVVVVKTAHGSQFRTNSEPAAHDE